MLAFRVSLLRVSPEFLEEVEHKWCPWFLRGPYISQSLKSYTVSRGKFLMNNKLQGSTFARASLKTLREDLKGFDVVI